MLSTSPTSAQSASSPTFLAAPYHHFTSCGSLNHGSSFHRPMNRRQQTRGSSTQIQLATCWYCKQLGHVIFTCPKRERIHGPYSPRSSVATYAPTSAPQPLAGSLLSDQLSQIASYLTQNLDITRATPTPDFTAMSATSGGSAPRIFASGATHHMTFDHSVLTCCSPVSDFTYIYIAHSTPLAATQSDNITHF